MTEEEKSSIIWYIENAVKAINNIEPTQALYWLNSLLEGDDLRKEDDKPWYSREAISEERAIQIGVCQKLKKDFVEIDKGIFRKKTLKEKIDKFRLEKKPNIFD